MGTAARAPELPVAVPAGATQTAAPDGTVPPLLPAGRPTAQGAAVAPNLALQWRLLSSAEGRWRATPGFMALDRLA